MSMGERVKATIVQINALNADLTRNIARIKRRLVKKRQEQEEMEEEEMEIDEDEMEEIEIVDTTS